jgi:arylsulfatase A-like enzyme
MKRFLLASLLFALSTAWPTTGASRPNIVVLLADDMRWDAMSCVGHPFLKTPNLDRLAAGGTRFENAFVTTSICCVSRASILTGQYARRHGVHDFKTPVENLDSMYPMLLRRGGYYTGFIGKWGIAAASGAYFQRCAAAFDFWAGDLGQTSYWHERTCNYLTNNGTSGRTNFFCSCPQPARRGEGCGPNGPHPSLKNPIHAETEFVPAKIQSFLDQRETTKPFCLSVSFKASHAPWRGYAPRFDNHFQGIAVPRRGNVTLAEAMRQPEFLRRSLESERGLRFVTNAAARNQLFHQYYRLIEGLDFCVGQLLKELQARGVATNTVILFTSDNGHFAGEHGFFGKWFMHEESLRVPMLLYDPRAPAGQYGQRSDAMTLNIDFAPTILELAGLPVPATMQGRSLLPLLRDPRESWRNEFFYEHLYEHGPKPPLHIEPCEGVRTRDWKYFVWLNQSGPTREELYDLRADPLETKNLAAEPAAAANLEELRRRHADLAQRAR